MVKYTSLGSPGNRPDGPTKEDLAVKKSMATTYQIYRREAIDTEWEKSGVPTPYHTETINVAATLLSPAYKGWRGEGNAYQVRVDHIYKGKVIKQEIMP